MQTAENKLIIGKKLITVFNEEIIENIPWSKVKVQLVAECSENVKVEVRIELGVGDDRRLLTCIVVSNIGDDRRLLICIE